jgi:hypothetical protein
LSLGFLSWLVLVMPVNASIERVASETPERVPAFWSELRTRWEYGHVIGFVLNLLGFCALAIAAVSDAPAAIRRVHTSTSLLIRAPKERVFGLYAAWQDWPRLFPKTIRGVQLIREAGNTREIDVDHVEGHVPNTMSIVSPELIVLEEQKGQFDARFSNYFTAVPEGTRYLVSADVTLRGSLGWLHAVAGPFIRSRIRHLVLEPMRSAAEGRVGSSRAAT